MIQSAIRECRACSEGEVGWSLDMMNSSRRVEGVESATRERKKQKCKQTKARYISFHRTPIEAGPALDRLGFNYARHRDRQCLLCCVGIAAEANLPVSHLHLFQCKSTRQPPFYDSVTPQIRIRPPQEHDPLLQKPASALDGTLSQADDSAQ